MSKFKDQVRKMRMLIFVLFILVLALVAYLMTDRRPVSNLPNLAISTVEIRDVEYVISVDGNLSPKNERSIYFPSGAEVTAVRVSEGQKIKKGASIARVKITTALGSTNKNITAPIAGTVTKLNFAKGDFITPNMPGAVISDTSGYLVEVSVNENDVIDIKKNQQVELIFPAFSLDEKFAAKVKKVDLTPINSVGSVNYLVEIAPSEVPKGIKLGMSVIAEILVDSVDDVLAIPESFLVESGEEFKVKRLRFLDEDRIEYEIDEVEVKIGLRTNEFVEITSGVSEGDELIEPSFTQERGFTLF